MSTDRPLLAALRRWDQVLVLALVVVLSDLASAWWLTHRGAAGYGGDVQQRQAVRTPGAEILDDELASVLQSAAQAQGLDPEILPAPRHLWSLFVEQSPAAAGVDVEDRAAVQRALEVFIGRLATSRRKGDPADPAGPPGTDGDRPPPPPPDAGDGGRAPPARGEGPPGAPSGAPPKAGGPPAPSPTPPTMAQLDEARAARLSELAREQGLDPASILPPESLRRAAVQSDDLRSAASQELLEAYRTAMSGLERHEEKN